mmetsp:Transcript_44040/g.126138  ORF Transcript_44040/g.126138 Transcript_44040/m.126138 type:complete len:234 (+) Transcript_44040:439-1140(+)
MSAALQPWPLAPPEEWAASPSSTARAEWYVLHLIVAALVVFWLKNCWPASRSTTSATNGNAFANASRTASASVRSPKLTGAASPSFASAPPAAAGAASRQVMSAQTPRAVGSRKIELPPEPGMACTASKSRASGIFAKRITFKLPGSGSFVTEKPSHAFCTASLTMELTPSQPATRPAGASSLRPPPPASWTTTMPVRASTDSTRTLKAILSLPPAACRASNSVRRAPQRSDW